MMSDHFFVLSTIERIVGNIWRDISVPQQLAFVRASPEWLLNSRTNLFSSQEKFFNK